jgi:hypothetical protein
MIALLVPTIRGEMDLSETSQDVFGEELDFGDRTVNFGDTSFFSLKINQTGQTAQTRFDGSTAETGVETVTFISDEETTFSTSLSTFSTEESSSSSESTGFGLASHTTTTITESWLPTTTATRTQTVSAWTTQTDETNSTKTADFKFTTTSKSLTDIRPTTIAATRTVTQGTALSGATTPANVYDTIIEAEGNEHFLYYTEGQHTSEWNGVGLPVTGVLRGTRLTLEATVETESIISNTVSQTLAIAEITTQVPRHILATGSAQTSATIWTNKTVFPPATFLQTITFSTGTTESFVTSRLRAAATITHYGNTRTVVRRPFLAALTTYTGLLNDGRTVSTLNNDLLVGGQITFLDTETFGEYIENASGNTTFVPEQSLRLRVVASAVGAGQEGFVFPYEGGACSVVRPVGALLSSSTGSYFSVASANAPSFTGFSFYAKVSRAVEEDDFALWTLLNTKNDSFTISETQYVWTTTTSSSDTTLATTASSPIAVAGESTLRVVATKNVLGGAPEKSATFYERVPAGVYLDDNNNYSTMGGEVSSYTEARETVHLRAVPVLTNRGNPLAVLDRNSILRNGEFAQTLVELF